MTSWARAASAPIVAVGATNGLNQELTAVTRGQGELGDVEVTLMGTPAFFEREDIRRWCRFTLEMLGEKP